MIRRRTSGTIARIAAPTAIYVLPVLDSTTNRGGSSATVDEVDIVALILFTLAQLVPKVLAHRRATQRERNQHRETCYILSHAGSGNPLDVTRVIGVVRNAGRC